jgi:hypothetical protein
VALTVTDDGKGFDPNRIGGVRGLGLINMRERARQLHGTFELHSEPGAAPRSGHDSVPASGVTAAFMRAMRTTRARRRHVVALDSRSPAQSWRGARLRLR